MAGPSGRGHAASDASARVHRNPQGEGTVSLATDVNPPGAAAWVVMPSCFRVHFMLVLEKQEKYVGHQQFLAIVQLIGTRKQAENCAYRLELSGPRRRLTWEAPPRSIHEGVATAVTKSDCLVFDARVAQLFEENGNLGIDVTISMCSNGSQTFSGQCLKPLHSISENKATVCLPIRIFGTWKLPNAT